MDGSPTGEWAANLVWEDKFYIAPSRGFRSSSTTTAWVKILWVTETANSAARAFTPTTALRSSITTNRKTSSTRWPSLLPETWAASMAATEASSAHRAESLTTT